MTHSADHDAYIARGYCPSVYDDGDRWCRYFVDHPDPHVAPWEHTLPHPQMVRWTEGVDGPENVQWLRWEPE